MSVRSFGRSVGAFSAALAAENAAGRVAVIPDIKCVSPGEGALAAGRDPVGMARRFVACGAPVLSVVTEPEHFGGSLELLRAVAEATQAPVLRKDLIADVTQLDETRACGAAAVLLICATTDEPTLRTLYAEALARGLEPLVEAHTAAELALAMDLGARLAGINNRDITVLERDRSGPELTESLASAALAGRLLISESGITSVADAQRAAAAGADAVLVGTALWQADDPEALYQALRVERVGRGEAGVARCDR